MAHAAFLLGALAAFLYGWYLTDKWVIQHRQARHDHQHTKGLNR